MLTIIQAAIEGRRVLQINYSPGMRLIEPHCLGRGSGGQLLLRAFQTEGASASGEPENWKLFRLDRMYASNDTGTAFAGPRPEYNPDDPVMTRGIIARL
jgi:predicted DNA-binding transcriptional regulator YafY